MIFSDLHAPIEAQATRQAVPRRRRETGRPFGSCSSFAGVVLQRRYAVI